MFSFSHDCSAYSGQCSQNVDVNGPHHRCFELIVSSSFNQPMVVEQGRSHELVGSMMGAVYVHVPRTLIPDNVNILRKIIRVSPENIFNLTKNGMIDDILPQLLHQPDDIQVLKSGLRCLRTVNWMEHLGEEILKSTAKF